MTSQMLIGYVKTVKPGKPGGKQSPAKYLQRGTSWHRDMGDYIINVLALCGLYTTAMLKIM